MIDKNKPLEAYTDEELIEVLNSKNDQESYFLLNLVYEENKYSDKYYHLFDEFLKMIKGKTSFCRMRGFGLCCSLAKWDVDNKIDRNLQDMLIVFEDDKPTTVRVAIASLIDYVIPEKPDLGQEIMDNLYRIDVDKYKETMAPLVKKDMFALSHCVMRNTKK